MLPLSDKRASLLSMAVAPDSTRKGRDSTRKERDPNCSWCEGEDDGAECACTTFTDPPLPPGPRMPEPSPRSRLHRLTIPDDLLAWGKDPEIAVHFARPWAHEVEAILAEGTTGPLRSEATDRLLARLEALCSEAIRAGRPELLVGFDMFTAEWLGLVFSWQTPSGDTVTVGRDQRWSYSEVRALLETQGSREAMEVAGQVKCLVSGAFPQARIGAILDVREAPPEVCTGCGKESSIMLTFGDPTDRDDSPTAYCSKCWLDLTSDKPPIPKKVPRQTGRRR